MNKYAVFDTNSLPFMGSLNGRFWQSIIRLCSEMDIIPAVPEIVLEELRNLRIDLANEHLNALAASRDRLSRLYEIEPFYVPSAVEVAEEFVDDVRANFEVLPLSDGDAAESLRREARRRVPARLGRGGRDTAVWLTVVGLIKEGNDIWFITANHKDFGKGELHPQLKEEISEHSGSVQYIKDGDAFVQSVSEKLNSDSIADVEASHIVEELVRQQLVSGLDEADHRVYNFSRVLDSQMAVSINDWGQAYVVNSHGMARATAEVLVADPSGFVWATVYLDAWLHFDLNSRLAIHGEVVQMKQEYTEGE